MVMLMSVFLVLKKIERKKCIWISLLRSAHVPCARSCIILNFILWCLRFVGLQWGTSFMAPFWHLDFDVAYKFFENCRLQLSFTSRNGMLRFEENMTCQGFVCVCACQHRGISPLFTEPTAAFFQISNILISCLHSWTVGWPSSSHLYSYLFCCILYLF
jgi:hypothetical protein